MAEHDSVWSEEMRLRRRPDPYLRRITSFDRPHFVIDGREQLLWLPRIPKSINWAYNPEMMTRWYKSEASEWMELLGRAAPNGFAPGPVQHRGACVDAWYFTSALGALDADNAVASMKPLFDAMVRRQMLTDDDEGSFVGWGCAVMLRMPESITLHRGVLLRLSLAEDNGYNRHKNETAPHEYAVASLVRRAANALSIDSVRRRDQHAGPVAS